MTSSPSSTSCYVDERISLLYAEYRAVLLSYKISTTQRISDGGLGIVGIAADYGLDGPASNPGGDEIFRPSRPALGPTQTPVQ